MSLSAEDRTFFEAKGIPYESVETQIDRIRKSSDPVTVLRPCRNRDGINLIPEGIESRTTVREAIQKGRLAKFVPASGAASRMFEFLLRQYGAGEDAEVEYFFSKASQLAFFSEWNRALTRKGTAFDALVGERKYETLIESLLGNQGLGFYGRPKGLIPFHLYDGLAATAVFDHAAEFSRLTAEGAISNLHLTVQGEHRSLFEEHAEFCHRNFPNVRISFSIQDSKYDTVSLDNDGLMVREKSGRPHLRPGGHGALLHNLQAANFDLVWIKNVDNIAPQDRHEAINRENLRMLAYYLELEEAVHTSLRKLDEGQVPDIVFLKDKFGISVPAQTNTREFLNRPIRVCGMVPNQRDPGGGPFWVDAKGTEFRQIVELSQINTRSQDQRSKVAKSTHFNPVDMICGVRDYQGRPFNLSDFANPDRYIVSRKTYDGRPIFVLEWPGLWNGQMEKWMTVFVEVPRFVFNPVKTALDLLRPAHQVEEK